MTRKVLVLVLVGIVLLAGCGSQQPQTETVGIEGPIMAESIGFTGDMWATNTTFRMDGELIGCYHDDVGPDECQNVTIELYNQEGHPLYTHRVGTLDGEAAVSFTAPVVPYYVFVFSPDFWGHDVTDVEYYSRWNAHNFTVHVVDSQHPEELPVLENVTRRESDIQRGVAPRYN